MKISLMIKNISGSQVVSSTLIVNQTGLYPELANMKREHETLVMFQLSRPIIKLIKTGAFPNPTFKPFKSQVLLESDE